MSLHEDIFVASITYLSEQYGPFGIFIGYLAFLSPIVSILLEVSTLLTKLTDTKYDDVVFRKVSYYWDFYVDPILALIPRVNVPVAAWVVMIAGLCRRIVQVIRKHRHKGVTNESKSNVTGSDESKPS